MIASAAGATELDLIIPPSLSGGDEAAYSVAIDGQRVAVGLPGAGDGSGAVVIFNCSATGCVQEQRLELSPARSGAAFGSSLAIGGDVLAAGLPQRDGGAVRLYRRSGGGTWSLEREFASATTGDKFGLAIALGSGYVAVAAPESGGGNGRVELYADSGGSWSHAQTLTAPANGGRFGQALALNGATLLVGAPFLAGATPGSYARGSSYAYTLSTGTWSLQATLQANAAADGDLFGYSVALDGDIAVIGAPRRAATQGRGFVFQRSAAVWTQQAELSAGRSLPGDYMGWSAAISGSRAGLGAPFASEDPGENCGRLQLFDGPGTWRENSLGEVARPQAGELSGWAVAVSGERWLAGAPGRSIGLLPHYGAVYRFDPDQRLFADGFETPESPCAP
ncbi:MAG: hypothetical protein JNN30_06595 [Rhodanobacteraceae bacterium]|nr:hypothetical protein [Rhodanobacteraceae bacterium]